MPRFVVYWRFLFLCLLIIISNKLVAAKMLAAELSALTRLPNILIKMMSIYRVEALH